MILRARTSKIIYVAHLGKRLRQHSEIRTDPPPGTNKLELCPLLPNLRCARVVRGLCGGCAGILGQVAQSLGRFPVILGPPAPSDPTPKAMQFNRIRCIFNDAGVTSPSPLTTSKATPHPKPCKFIELQRFSKILWQRYFQKHANP